MKKNLLKISLLCLSAVCGFGLVSCNQDNTPSSTSSPTSPSDTSSIEEKDKNYNIIFAKATIPPVLGALDSIVSENETYAMIERGNTYSGIDMDLNIKFNNVEFDKDSNQSNGFTQAEFNKIVNKIKELNQTGKEKFNIYVRDADHMIGFALVANAGLKEGQYEIFLCEDGSGSYENFKKTYVNNKSVTESADQPYEAYLSAVEQAKKERDAILAKTDNKLSEIPWRWEGGCATAALDHVTWRIQDKAKLINYLKTTGDSKLLSALGAEGYTEETEYSSNIVSKSISDCVKDLDADAKEDYLTLMFGKYKEDTYNALTRTQLSDGTKVPSKKLVYIGTRVQGYPELAVNANFGIGKADGVNDVPATYSALADKYKTPLLFGNENDYKVFMDVVTADANYTSSVTAEQKEAVKVSCFNNYIDYVLNLKFTYAMYGNDYDIIIKGHPSEVVGKPGDWTQHYDAGNYRYDTLFDKLISEFHTKDSIGKKIGMVPYGTAAENLAYLGADISIGGLDSSTYAGYEPSVDVKFLMVAGTTSGEKTIVDNTNIGSRYTAGTLSNHNADGTVADTVFYNNGRFFKAMKEYYQSINDSNRKSAFETMLNNWLNKNNATDVNDQGQPVSASAE